MSFAKIIGQEQVLSLFKNALKNERLAHAYIFAGQEGIGKMSFARELAKKIFCQSGKIDGACDNCNICKRIDADNFTDIFFLLPEKNHRVIKLEQLKYLQEILFVKPLESKHKIVIVEDADKMNEEASNCLLKTLEEPPLYAIILLIVTSLESVSETIKSRCQVVRFSPLSLKAMENILTDRFQLDKQLAAQLALISGGSLKRAAMFMEANALEKKHWLAEKLFEVSLKDNLAFSKELLNEWNIQDMEVLEEKRSHVKELFLLFLMYYRDILICKAGGEHFLLYYDDWKDALIAKSKSLSEKTLFKILERIKTSLKYLDCNANINLLIENMITEILYLQSDPKAWFAQ
ncbi:MAG: DNA polymerase III subunit delta' [Candidatus Kuenenia stuttgartiensis]|nr:MAG: DNA polymerase III subunit delta' [Candidatus Kuenenia stuttgartiensis]